MGEMAVWMARDKEKVRLNRGCQNRSPSVASFGELEKVQTGYNDQNDDISAVYDGVEPINSADESHLYYRLRPPPGQPAWLEYRFEKPTEVSSTKVYWVDDRRFCRLPETWRILYKDGGTAGRPVANRNDYRVAKDQFNEVDLRPGHHRSRSIGSRAPEASSTGRERSAHRPPCF